MSRVFYDYLLSLEEIESAITQLAESQDEKQELWQIVDELLHTRILFVILTHLPSERHTEFLERYHDEPHNEEHVLYLNESCGIDMEEIIKNEVKELKKEILRELYQEN
jgi:hypothetical protein